MSVERVLGAAAVLGTFTLPQIAARCDERAEAIPGILAAAAPAVELVADGDAGPCWRVVDRAALRRRMSAEPVTAVPDPREERLRYVEETLVRCADEDSAHQRGVLVSTAVNHLRQVLAHDLPDRPAWWSVQLTDGLDGELSAHPDQRAGHRLRLDVNLARFAVRNVEGRTIPTSDLLDAVARFRAGVAHLGGQELLAKLVGGFIDLATAQVATDADSGVDRLLVAVARRRVRAQADTDVDGAMRALEPLVRGLGPAADVPVRELHRTLGELPDGRTRDLVYTDLLPLVPGRAQLQRQTDRVPGTMVEVVTDPWVSDHLAWCARTIEKDLRISPVRSDRGLIGQAVHIMRDIVECTPDADGEARQRADHARSELFDLAQSKVWPAPTAPAPERAR